MNDGALKTSGDINGVLGGHRSDAERWEILRRVRRWGGYKKISRTNLYRGCV